jgi:hypothetical protein
VLNITIEGGIGLASIMPSSELLKRNISIAHLPRVLRLYCHATNSSYAGIEHCLSYQIPGLLSFSLLNNSTPVVLWNEGCSTDLEEADIRGSEAASVSNIIITKHIQQQYNNRDPSQTRRKYKQWQWKLERIVRNNRREKKGENLIQTLSFYPGNIVHSWRWGCTAQETILSTNRGLVHQQCTSASSFPIESHLRGTILASFMYVGAVMILE